MNVIADLALAAVRDHLPAGTRLERYEELVLGPTDAALPACGKAWYGQRYRELAGELDWFSRSLVINAEKEAEGSGFLWDLAGRIEDAPTRELVRKHAIDEGRHCLYYVSLISSIFPRLPKEPLARLKALSPGYDVNDVPPTAEHLATPRRIVVEFLRINMSEIRTRIQQLLMRPVALAYAPTASRDIVASTIDRLGADEARHIAYTAQLIDDFAAHDHAFIREAARKRWVEFDQLTIHEVDSGRFESD